MEFRRAEEKDLVQVKQVFERIATHMEAQGLSIWDEVYPCAFFAEDIEKGRLFVLADGERIVSAFALCADNAGAFSVLWPNGARRAMYLDRFGVSVEDRGRGVGRLMLQKARQTAAAMGAETLRLFVVDENAPAIRLYERAGFMRAEGVFDEVIDEELTLREYGYEIPASQSGRDLPTAQ